MTSASELHCSHEQCNSLVNIVETRKKSRILLLLKNRVPAECKWWGPSILIVQRFVTKQHCHAFLKKRKRKHVPKRALSGG